jgi:hypothetical protein
MSSPREAWISALLRRHCLGGFDEISGGVAEEPDLGSLKWTFSNANLSEGFS